MPSGVLPVARPRTILGFARTAAATMRAASWLTSLLFSLRTTSILGSSPRISQSVPSQGCTARSGCATKYSTEAPDHEIVAIGTVNDECVDQRFVRRRENDLANAKERLAPRYAEEFSDMRFGAGGVNFFVRVAEFQVVVALKEGKERLTVERSVKKFREILV